MNKSSNIAKVLLTTVFVAILGICGFLYFKPWNNQQMYVANKTWDRSISECEDYTTTECVPVENCTSVKNNRVCTTSIRCTTTNHTRTHNTWNTSGNYKIEPSWPVVPTIPSSHYFKYYEVYVVHFKRDTEELPYRAWNLGDYERLKFEGVYTVTTNIFNIAIRAE